MYITTIADTHGLHDKLKLNGGDLLIHAGDITEYGTKEELDDFVRWFAKQPYHYKIFIGGNHDLWLEEKRFVLTKPYNDNHVFYLQNSGITIKGINIYGSPVSPYFLGMAFNKKRGIEIKKCWNKIPCNTTILITHTPPLGVLDNGLGCHDLLHKVQSLRPHIHIFGHIHGQQSILTNPYTTFINAAMAGIPNPVTGEQKIVATPVDINL